MSDALSDTRGIRCLTYRGAETYKYAGTEGSGDRDVEINVPRRHR